MANGKNLILHDGYTYYKLGKKRGCDKWKCTSNPNCKSHVLTDAEGNLVEVVSEHLHVKKKLLKTSAGTYIRL